MISDVRRLFGDSSNYVHEDDIGLRCSYVERLFGSPLHLSTYILNSTYNLAAYILYPEDWVDSWREGVL